MRSTRLAAWIAGISLAGPCFAAPAAGEAGDKPAVASHAEDGESPRHLKDESQRSAGTLTIGGKAHAYQAEAGVLVVRHQDPMDADPVAAGDKAPAPVAQPEASLSYVAYFLGKEPDARRPITFLFNGGPGSSTIWLHMGAFGPKRVLIVDGAHAPAAPYAIVDNAYSLLPESDLVFVDAPGTGFGHLRGTDKEKAFFGVDPDVHAFANFIVEFLSRHGRWNSPKYVFGESYGTTRGAALVAVLQIEKGLDLNGLIFLSQSLAYDGTPDLPELNPSVDHPFALALPTYAATAWYHKKLANPPTTLEPLLAEVESFALGEYLTALAAGNRLSPERHAAIAAKLHDYTGLPPDIIERANLRITPTVFENHVLGSSLTTGRLDSRFTGPTLDPLSKDAEYDPQSTSITSAFTSAFNDYVRRELRYGNGQTYKISNGDAAHGWDFLHQPPGAQAKVPQATNVIPDLAVAMKLNPNLRLMMNGGYYDLSTPYFAALYELDHLPVPPAIARNIEVKLYPSGHMVYANEASLAALEANVAAFIRRTHPAH